MSPVKNFHPAPQYFVIRSGHGGPFLCAPMRHGSRRSCRLSEKDFRDFRVLTFAVPIILGKMA